jgi:hypothetical protein
MAIDEEGRPLPDNNESNQFEKETRMWTLEKLINEIDSLDDITKIVDFVKSKRKQLASNNATHLNIGQKVRISGSNRIEEGVITKVNRSRAVVDVNGVSWTVPFEMIRVTEAK